MNSTEEELAPVTVIRTPIDLPYTYSAGHAQSRFLAGLAHGKFLGQRCPVCSKVTVPPRGACPTCGVPTTDEVECANTGTITTFCVVNINFTGQQIQVPYVCAQVLLDGSNQSFMALVQECDAADGRMGMRVEALWNDPETWTPSFNNIRYFRPTGEPDAAYDTFAEYL